MSSLEQAMAVINHYSSQPAYLGSVLVHLQFSNRQQISTRRNHILIASISREIVPVTIDHIYQARAPHHAMRGHMQPTAHAHQTTCRPASGHSQPGCN